MFAQFLQVSTPYTLKLFGFKKCIILCRKSNNTLIISQFTPSKIVLAGRASITYYKIPFDGTFLGKIESVCFAKCCLEHQQQQQPYGRTLRVNMNLDYFSQIEFHPLLSSVCHQSNDRETPKDFGRLLRVGFLA